MSVRRPPRAWRLFLGALCLGVLQLFAVQAWLMADAVRTFRAELHTGFDAQALRIIQATVERLERSPLPQAGTNPFATPEIRQILTDAVSQHVAIRYMLLADLTGQIQVAVHDADTLAHPGVAENAPGLPAKSLPDRDGDELVMPVQRAGAGGGQLHVGQWPDTWSGLSGSWWLSQAGVLLLGILVMAVILHAVWESALAAPERLLSRMRAEVASGVWRRDAAIQGAPEIAAVLTRISGATQQVNERWRQLSWLAAELETVDPSWLPQVLATRTPLAAANRFPDADGPVRVAPSLTRPLLLLFGTCILAFLRTCMELAMSWSAAPVQAVLPLLLLVVAIGIALMIAVPTRPFLGDRILLPAGLLASAAGHGVSATATHDFLAGLGIALIAAGAGAVVLACRSRLATIRAAGWRIGGGHIAWHLAAAAMSGAILAALAMDVPPWRLALLSACGCLLMTLSLRLWARRQPAEADHAAS